MAKPRPKSQMRRHDEPNWDKMWRLVNMAKSPKSADNGATTANLETPDVGD